MININDYINEKLYISKEYKTPIKYFEGDIEDFTDGKITTKEVDDRLAELRWPDNNYFGPGIRNNTVRNHNNKLWYAIYCYLWDVGPKKTEDIINFLKPGGSRRSEMFSVMRSRNIITAGKKEQRGLQIPNPPKDWIR